MNRHGFRLPNIMFSKKYGRAFRAGLRTRAFSDYVRLGDSRGLQISFAADPSSNASTRDTIDSYERGVEAYAARSLLRHGDPRIYFSDALSASEGKIGMPLALCGLGLSLHFQQHFLPPLENEEGCGSMDTLSLETCLGETRRIYLEEETAEYEKLHIQGFHAACSGDYVLGSRFWEAVLRENPTDLLACRALHDAYFKLGDFENLKQFVTRILPYWDPSVQGYSLVLGMHSYGLAENGMFAEAEEAGMRALNIDSSNETAIQSICKCFLGTSKPREGLRFLREVEEQWKSADEVARVVSWWRALYHLEHGDDSLAMHQLGVNFNTEEALVGRPLVANDFVYATLVLWVIKLRGQETDGLSDKASYVVEGLLNAVKDCTDPLPHLNVCLTMLDSMLDTPNGFSEEAKGKDLSDVLLKGENKAHHDLFVFTSAERDTNGNIGENAHSKLIGALEAFNSGNHEKCVRSLLQVRHQLQQSLSMPLEHVDVIEQTLLDSAEKNGDINLARVLHCQRSFERPYSPYVWMQYGRVLTSAGQIQAAEAALSYAQTLGWNQRGFGAH